MSPGRRNTSKDPLDLKLINTRTVDTTNENAVANKASIQAIGCQVNANVPADAITK